MSYKDLTKEELKERLVKLRERYQDICSQNVKLDMSRGKPGPDQLEISMGLFDVFHSASDLKAEDGLDCRNYGLLDGLPEAKRLMGEIMNASPDNIIIYGNSSLNVMYDTVARSYCEGVMGSTPWCYLDKVKWLCPVPGYDRHFAITEHFGIEMINIPLYDDGPDMDMVEKLVSEDETIKGIWCVPKYSNPTGISYSDEVVKRMASLKPAAKDFRIYWDNAYAVHHLYDDNQAEVLNIIEECEKAGNPDMAFKFASTSKITFPGVGIAALASSDNNLKYIRAQMAIQTIGHDKINQLRHYRYFKNIDGVRRHMKKHADLMRPKFRAVLNKFESELAPDEIATWTDPYGGYFISLEVMDGCAKKIVGMCKDAGLVLTGAGATYPYGKDPKDSNIRIAPSYPTPQELEMASDILVVCIKIATIEKMLDA